MKRLSLSAIRVDWLRGALILSVLAMEATWLSPWVTLLDPFMEFGGRRHSVVGTYALLLVAFVGSLAIRSLRASRWVRAVLQVALMLASTLVLIWAELYTHLPLLSTGWVVESLQSIGVFPRRVTPEIPLLFLALYAWYRAATLAGTTIVTGDVVTHFRRSFVVIALYTLLALVSPQRVPWEILAFFTFGIISVSLARLLEAKVQVGDWEWSRRWLVTLVQVTALTLGIGLIALLLLTAYEFAAGRFVLGVGRELLEELLGFWAQLPGYVLNWLFNAIAAYLEGRPVPEFGFPPPGNPGPGGFDPIEPFNVPMPPFALMAQILVLGLLGLVVVWIVRRVSRRGRRRRRRPGVVEREALDDVKDDEESGWERVLSGLKHSRLFSRTSTRSVRHIYASMVAYAGEVGHPADPIQTPYELLPLLREAFPNAQEAVEEITEAYVRVHYAEEPETQQELERVRALWKHLESMELDRWSLRRRK